MLQTHALSIKRLMRFLSINKRVSILHVCSTKTAKIKHRSLLSPGKVTSWIFPLQMKIMLLLQIKALCSPLLCLTVPCKYVRGAGWVVPQHLTAFERLKPSPASWLCWTEGCIPPDTLQNTLQKTLPSVCSRLSLFWLFCIIIFWWPV